MPHIVIQTTPKSAPKTRWFKSWFLEPHKPYVVFLNEEAAYVEIGAFRDQEDAHNFAALLNRMTGFAVQERPFIPQRGPE